MSSDFTIRPGRWESLVSQRQGPVDEIPRRDRDQLDPLVGFLTGFLTGVTNAAGPTLAIHLYSLKLDKRTFVKIRRLRQLDQRPFGLTRISSTQITATSSNFGCAVTWRFPCYHLQ